MISTLLNILNALSRSFMVSAGVKYAGMNKNETLKFCVEIFDDDDDYGSK